MALMLHETRSLAVVDPFQRATRIRYRQFLYSLIHIGYCVARHTEDLLEQGPWSIAREAYVEGRLDEMAAIVGEIVDAGFAEAA